MPKYTVWVETDDDKEYSLDKSFSSRKAAEAELADILSGEPSYLDDGMIIDGRVEKD